MMSTHCAHNAPPTSFKWPPVRGWDAELLAWYRTIPAGNVFIRLTSVSAASATCKNAGNCKFSFTRQHSCASLSLSRWCSTSSQRCRINGLPDLVYYWASLKGGKKRALDFDWWVPLSSQITVHPSPNSHVPGLLFSHNHLLFGFSVWLYSDYWPTCLKSYISNCMRHRNSFLNHPSIHPKQKAVTETAK